MFGRKKSTEISGRIDTLISRTAKVRGDVEFSGGLHLEGAVIGQVTAAPGAEATLWVSEHGSIEGSVDVPQVVLNGTVRGDVRAPGRLVLGAKARVEGDVEYGAVEMAMGAQVNGKLMPMNGASVASGAPAGTAPAAAGPRPVPAGPAGSGNVVTPFDGLKSGT